MLAPGTLLRAGQSSLLAVTETPGWRSVEVENALAAHPAIAEIAIVSRKHEVYAATLFLADLVFAGPLRAPATIPPFT